jgi:hypothetical protein
MTDDDIVDTIKQLYPQPGDTARFAAWDAITKVLVHGDRAYHALGVGDRAGARASLERVQQAGKQAVVYLDSMTPLPPQEAHGCDEPG